MKNLNLISFSFPILILTGCRDPAENENTSSYDCTVEVLFESTKHEISGNITMIKVFNNARVTDISFANDMIGYVTGWNSLAGLAAIAKTTDGGDTWSTLTLWSEREYPTEVKFVDDNIGYALTFSSNIYATYNGGESWLFMKSFSDGYGYCSSVLNGDDIYIVASNRVFHTQSDFKTMESLYEGISLSKIVLSGKKLLILTYQNEGESILSINI